ncbi:MAG: hypothetical protein IKI23_04230, partial [Lachnospiraceae bacterium]|nr:hypothetical protein [Lachnospiraceae bacterium]
MKGYDRYPAKKIADTGGSVFKGQASILKRLKEELTGKGWTLVLETYPGVSEGEVLKLIRGLGPDLVIPASDMLLDPEKRQPLLDGILTDDRVFGRMY